MQCIRFRRVSWLLLTGLLLLPHAQVTAGERQEIDARIAQLKATVLEGEADLQHRLDALLYPEYARTTILVDQRIGGFLLEELRILLDGREVFAHSYREAESYALTEGGVQRALRLALAPGEYTLTTEFTGTQVRRRGDQERVTGRSEGRFVKAGTPLDITIPLQASPRRGERSILAAEASDDPRLGHARWLTGSGEHFSALVELRRMDRSEDGAPLPEDYHWLLAENYLAYGMPQQADRVYRRLDRTTENRDRFTSAMLDMAEFEYHRGYLFEAIQRLRSQRSDAERRHLLRWQDLTSRVLLAQGRYGEAADVLQERADRSRHTPYMRYNLGVALINSGRPVEGQSVLDEVARYPARDAMEYALRDRANMMLGYHFLRQRHGGTAKPMFARVRVDGPYSNRALLGMGWSELAPEGDRQRRTDVDERFDEDERYRNVANLGVLVRPGFFEADIYRRLANRPFRRASIDEDEEAALSRALAYWSELIKRDPMDSAVQEAWLAIPYALDRLGAYEQGLDYYLRAVEIFEEALERVDAGIRSVEGALMLNTIIRRDAHEQSGYRWRLLDLPDLPETYWLNQLLAEHRFQEQLKNFRDTRQLAARLLRFNERAVAAMEGMDLPPPPDTQRRGHTSRLAATDLPALRLRMERELRAHERRDRPLPPVTPPRLIEAAAPAEFRGPREDFLNDIGDFTAQRAELSRLAEEQSRSVRALATSELREQREMLEKYLIEARFAVARAYDRRIRQEGGAR